ncbi:MAG TPA: putative manganese transporter, partial [Myxococcota bacterium]|nr:putative manganese transporter [Myxococcota bacterium]
AEWRRPHAVRLGLLGLVGLAVAGVLTGVLGGEAWNWVRVSELALAAVGAFVVVTAPDEYLVDHLLRHVVVRHLPKVAAWTVGTLVLLALAEHYVDLARLLGDQVGWVILGAGLVGLLPDASPQLLFVFLYAQGAVPFSVLLTSAIVQDGHGMLPLLSTGLRDPLILKGLKLALGLAVGFGVWACGH